MEKELLQKLEDLVLYAENQRKAAHKEDCLTHEEMLAQAYEDGAFAAFCIAKKVIEGDYEVWD